MTTKLKISVVIPAFNEAQRLPKSISSLKLYLSEKSSLFEIEKIVIVDDGSMDNTADVIQDAKKEWSIIEMLRLEKNSGKGHAVRRGLSYCAKECVRTDWILMADADGATAWRALETAKKEIETDAKLFLVMGSRQHQDSVIQPRQPFYREFLGKTFNFLLRKLSGVSFKDTQCGFKIFKNDFRLKDLLTKLLVDRFAWDAEAILWTSRSGYPMVEIAVEWAHCVESRVHLLCDSVEMLYSLAKIRLSIARRTNKSKAGQIS